MIKYSEEQMGTAFHYYMKHGQMHKIGHCFQIFYEFSAMQGVADFIAVHREGFIWRPSSVLYKLHTDSMVYSLLKKKAGRSKAYLYENVMAEKKSCNAAISELENAGIIFEKGGLYYQSDMIDNTSTTIWAFELKLSDWKRAIFQCLQYQAYANYSVAVFPDSKFKVLNDNLHYFIDLNIGVLLFNPIDRKGKWLFYPRKSTGKMSEARAYVLLKIHNLGK